MEDYLNLYKNDSKLQNHGKTLPLTSL